ncbi:MAG: hypothetical protein ACYDAG_01650 [Chloroflexota bacterium]
MDHHRRSRAAAYDYAEITIQKALKSGRLFGRKIGHMWEPPTKR